MSQIAREWTLLTCPHCGELWEGASDDTSTYECAYCGKQAVGVPIVYAPVNGAVSAFTAEELHCLTCAMAGNFSERFAPIRMSLLRKLAKASRAVTE